MNFLKTWWLAIRPHTLSAGAVPVVVGSALAFTHGAFAWELAGLTLLGALLVQIGANLTDEYADHDATGSSGKYLAPHKVIARGLLTAHQVKRGAMAAFVVATAIGAYLVWRSDLNLLWLCLASLVVAWAYSAGPLPLGDQALGEVLVFVFMGPVMVLGTVYVQWVRWDWEALFLALPVGGLVTAILMANNLRDFEEDHAQGRRTLATLYGPHIIKIAYLVLLVWVYLIPPALVGAGWGGGWLMLPWLGLPLAYQLGWQIWRGGSIVLRHQAIPRSSLHHLLFGTLLAAGLLLDHWLGRY